MEIGRNPVNNTKLSRSIFIGQLEIALAFPEKKHSLLLGHVVHFSDSKRRGQIWAPGGRRLIGDDGTCVAITR
jgi:hypothetical protein